MIARAELIEHVAVALSVRAGPQAFLERLRRRVAEIPGGVSRADEALSAAAREILGAAADGEIALAGRVVSALFGADSDLGRAWGRLFSAGIDTGEAVALLVEAARGLRAGETLEAAPDGAPRRRLPGHVAAAAEAFVHLLAGRGGGDTAPSSASTRETPATSPPARFLDLVETAIEGLRQYHPAALAGHNHARILDEVRGHYRDTGDRQADHERLRDAVEAAAERLEAQAPDPGEEATPHSP